MTAEFIPYSLHFKRPSGTSRGTLHKKDTWFIKINDNGKIGIGEAGMFRGLSFDDRPDFENKLQWACDNIKLGLENLSDALIDFPSIVFGLETAFKSLNASEQFLLFPSGFTEGNDAIKINGLIWMGEKRFMKEQIINRIDEGFDCIKLKIGAIDFEEEINLIRFIRKEFTPDKIELRVDANGAFKPNVALEKLKILSDFDIHSIEQPIEAGQWDAMSSLCKLSPIDIALDEELIGVNSTSKMIELLHEIAPRYIILKPTLIGGFQKTSEWINAAKQHDINWWITSALESNVGLNAIAQYTYTLNNSMPQGLGTGSLFTNNIDCPLIVKNGTLRYFKENNWNFNI